MRGVDNPRKSRDKYILCRNWDYGLFWIFLLILFCILQCIWNDYINDSQYNRVIKSTGSWIRGLGLNLPPSAGWPWTKTSVPQDIIVTIWRGMRVETLHVKCSEGSSIQCPPPPKKGCYYLIIWGKIVKKCLSPIQKRSHVNSRCQYNMCVWGGRCLNIISLFKSEIK